MELEKGEEPVGFLDDEAGREISNFILQRSCLPLLDSLGGLDPPSLHSLSSFASSDDSLGPDAAKPLSRQSRRRFWREFRTLTMRKTVANKVKPVDFAPSDGSTPDGDPLWREKALTSAQTKMQFGSKWDSLLVPRFTDLPKGTRLTEERLAGILATTDGFLTP